MYLTDYDDFFPTTNRDMNDSAANDYFTNHGRTVRGKDPDKIGDPCNHVRQGNPYLREPVILDDYTKNRDIWRCPSAKTSFVAKSIVPAGRNGYWVNNFIDNPTWYDDDLSRPCEYTFPSGWGGNVTDSFKQGAVPKGGTGAFTEGLGINDSLAAVKLSAVNDSARLIAVGEAGVSMHPWNANLLAYPDVCYVSNCGLASGCTAADTGCHAEWDNCPGLAAVRPGGRLRTEVLPGQRLPQDVDAPPGRRQRRLCRRPCQVVPGRGADQPGLRHEGRPVRGRPLSVLVAVAVGRVIGARA